MYHIQVILETSLYSSNFCLIDYGSWPKRTNHRDLKDFYCRFLWIYLSFIQPNRLFCWWCPITRSNETKKNKSFPFEFAQTYAFRIPCKSLITIPISEYIYWSDKFWNSASMEFASSIYSYVCFPYILMCRITVHYFLIPWVMAINVIPTRLNWIYW